HQRRSASIQQRPIHFAHIIIKNSQIRDLLRDRASCCSGIFASHRNQQHKSRTDRSGHVSFHAHTRAAYPLHHHPHSLSSRSPFRIIVPQRSCSQACAAKDPATAPGYTPPPPSPARLPPDPLRAPGQKYPPARDASRNIAPDPANRKSPAPPPLQMARDRFRSSSAPSIPKAPANAAA